ncbi:hypothetical protein Ancab_022124 [Ancistrocladus abbreviatus]
MNNGSTQTTQYMCTTTKLTNHNLRTSSEQDQDPTREGQRRAAAERMHPKREGLVLRRPLKSNATSPVREFSCYQRTLPPSLNWSEGPYCTIRSYNISPLPSLQPLLFSEIVSTCLAFKWLFPHRPCILTPVLQ